MAGSGSHHCQILRNSLHSGIGVPGKAARWHERWINDRQERLQERIDKLHGQLADAPEPPEEQCSIRVTALAAVTARSLLNEVLDWRAFFCITGLFRLVEK